MIELNSSSRLAYVYHSSRGRLRYRNEDGYTNMHPLGPRNTGEVKSSIASLCALDVLHALNVLFTYFQFGALCIDLVPEEELLCSVRYSPGFCYALPLRCYEQWETSV